MPVSPANAKCICSGVLAGAAASCPVSGKGSEASGFLTSYVTEVCSTASCQACLIQARMATFKCRPEGMLWRNAFGLLSSF